MASKKSAESMGWLRHVLTFLALLIFVMGCVLIGYMAWVLASSVTVSKFLEGDLMFTYVMIGLGFGFFFTGLLGWVGGSSESVCLVRLFFVALIIGLVVEIAGLLVLAIANIGMSKVVHSAWNEVDQGSRNHIQNHFNCCGWNGPKDFAYSTTPIDASCYETLLRSNSGLLVPPGDIDNDDVNIDNNDDRWFRPKKMKQSGCGQELIEWFDTNKVTWAAALASLLAVQALAFGITMFILSRVNKMRRLKKRQVTSRQRLYDDSSEESANFNVRK